MRIAVSRQPGAARDVSPLELFFDLVYVFAIGQLSHHLVEHVDLRTGAETVILALAATEIAGGHLVERFRLFFIIALGETVLTMGSAFASEPFGLERLLALAIGFAGTVALWWRDFQRAEALGARAAETAEDAGAVGLWGRRC
jgi:low temperature requirement protein LtrA